MNPRDCELFERFRSRDDLAAYSVFVSRHHDSLANDVGEDKVQAAWLEILRKKAKAWRCEVRCTCTETCICDAGEESCFWVRSKKGPCSVGWCRIVAQRQRVRPMRLPPSQGSPFVPSSVVELEGFRSDLQPVFAKPRSRAAVTLDHAFDNRRDLILWFLAGHWSKRFEGSELREALASIWGRATPPVSARWAERALALAADSGVEQVDGQRRARVAMGATALLEGERPDSAELQNACQRAYDQPRYRAMADIEAILASRPDLEPDDSNLHNVVWQDIDAALEAAWQAA